jgi:hypothetical protein
MKTNGNDPNSKIRRILEVKSKMDNLTFNILKVDPRVPIVLREDGHEVEYFLEYSLGAAIEVFKKTELNINSVTLSPSQIADLTLFPLLLEAGLRTHQPHVFRDGSDKLMSMVSVRHMTYYVACISKALEAIQPDQQQMAEILEDMKEAREDDPLVLTNTSLSSGPDVEILDAPMLKH